MSNESTLMRKYADMLKEGMDPGFAVNADQAKVIIHACQAYIDACYAEREEECYKIADEIVQLAAELQKSEENFDTADELSSHEDFRPPKIDPDATGFGMPGDDEY